MFPPDKIHSLLCFKLGLFLWSPSAFEQCKFTVREAKLQRACHASASPSDAHGNKVLKAVNMRRKPRLLRSPLTKYFSNWEEGGTHTHTYTCAHQSTQGLYKERSVVAKRQMQNNLHEKPDHDPSSSSSSSQTVSPSPTQLLPNIKAHLCHIKAEREGGRESEGGRRWGVGWGLF